MPILSDAACLPAACGERDWRVRMQAAAMEEIDLPGVAPVGMLSACPAACMRSCAGAWQLTSNCSSGAACLACSQKG